VSRMISVSQLLAVLSTLSVAVGAGLLWGFTHLEQLEIALTWLYRLFSWAGRSFKLRAVATQIQSRINVAAESIESEVQGVMPHPMKIKWIVTGEEQAQLSDGEVVVRVRNEFNDVRNIVTATTLYLSEGLLRDSRPYLDRTLRQALDLTVAWKMLVSTEESDLTHHFLTHIFNPAVEQHPLIQEDCEKIDDLDSKGVMTRVFMRELRGVGTKASSLREKPTHELRAETRSFTDFLHTIVASEKGSIYPLNFIGDKIRVGVLLLASMKTLAMSGLRVHKHWFKKKRLMGVETIYVLASGDRNIKLARHLAQWGQSERFAEIVRAQTFLAPSKLGKSETAVVITCHSTRVKADAFLDPEEEVHAILARHIPEVATGAVEVLDIVREIGTLTKVVVSTTREGLNPVEACIGPNRKYLDEVAKALRESVWFVEWHEDPDTFLVDCLSIPREKLVSSEIEWRSREARIVVCDRKTAAIAIGSKGVNARLTGKITGLRIQVLTADRNVDTAQPEPAPAPEDLLREAITAEIPELANGTISIIDVVREPGVQSKVVVRHSSTDQKAVPICLGPRKHHIKELVQALGESIWFVELDDDPASFLVGCLGVYPGRVLSVQIDDALRTAKVLVTDAKTCAKAIGAQGVNARQAAQLIGLRFIQIDVC